MKLNSVCNKWKYSEYKKQEIQNELMYFLVYKLVKEKAGTGLIA